MNYDDEDDDNNDNVSISGAVLVLSRIKWEQCYAKSFVVLVGWLLILQLFEMK